MSENETLAQIEGLRQHMRALEEQKGALKKEVEETDPYKRLRQLEDTLSLRAAELNDLEGAYRAACVSAYHATGEKQQPGGQVKVFSTLNYDEAAALEWSIDHGMRDLLKLNAAAFKKAAKVLSLDFVTIAEEPRMFLDSDLSAFLPKE